MTKRDWVICYQALCDWRQSLKRTNRSLRFCGLRSFSEKQTTWAFTPYHTDMTGGHREQGFIHLSFQNQYPRGYSMQPHPHNHYGMLTLIHVDMSTVYSFQEITTLFIILSVMDCHFQSLDCPNFPFRCVPFLVPANRLWNTHKSIINVYKGFLYFNSIKSGEW